MCLESCLNICAFQKTETKRLRKLKYLFYNQKFDQGFSVRSTFSRQVCLLMLWRFPEEKISWSLLRCSLLANSAMFWRYVNQQNISGSVCFLPLSVSLFPLFSPTPSFSAVVLLPSLFFFFAVSLLASVCLFRLPLLLFANATAQAIIWSSLI